MSADGPSLVRRVALVGAAAAALGGALAATFAGVLANRLVDRHEDHAVLAAARELAEEVAEEIEGDDDDDDDDDDIARDREGNVELGSVLAHELRDVKEPGASAAISRAGRTIAGDATLPDVMPGECVGDGIARRVCAVAMGDDRVVLGISTADERERWALLAWALAGGALVGAAIGGAASWRSASWALAPLDDLRDRVRRVDADAPRADALDPAARHAELEELRVAIAHLVERLGASLAQAQSFSAAAAHELRTPLAVLAGELELAIEAPHATDRAELVRLHERVQGLVALVQRLLVLAGPDRFTAGRGGEVVDLSDVVDACAHGLRAAESARLRTSVQDDVVVRGDPELLRTLLANAVENAMKFSVDDVEVRVAAVGDDAVIDVIDRGVGIPARDRERVFAPFFRTADARASKTPGHGVGLALIAHVAAAHGGRATFVDREGGAHLRIVLPRWSA